MNRTKQIYGDTRKELVGVVAQEDWADQLGKIYRAFGCHVVLHTIHLSDGMIAYRAYEEPAQGELGL